MKKLNKHGKRGENKTTAQNKKELENSVNNCSYSPIAIFKLIMLTHPSHAMYTYLFYFFYLLLFARKVLPLLLLVLLMMLFPYL